MIGGRFGRRPGLRLRDAVILTLPVTIAVGYAVISALLDYRNVRQFDDWWAHGAGFGEQLGARVAAAAAIPTVTSLRDRFDPSREDPYAIRLMAETGEWARLADITAEGWIDARVVREGGSQRVDVRRRGDTSVHWTTPKTSFTLRAPRGIEIRGFRELALTGKTVLESHVAHTLATDFGLQVPSSELTPVYLNEQYYGLFRAVEPIDESFLRRTGRMPGNIFRADRAERGEYYKNLPRNVFHNPYIWDRVASLNDPADEPLDRLIEFLRLVNQNSLEAHDQLMSRIDRDEISRLLALLLAVGDPYHMSGVHNQYWFEDPATGILHPIPWDLRLRSIDASPTNPVNPFLKTALRDPFITDGAMAAIRHGLETGLRDRVIARVDRAEQSVGAHLRYEELRSGLVSAPGAPDDVRRLLEANLDELNRRTEDARIGFAANRSEADPDVLVLDIEVRGWAGVDLVGLEISSGPGDVSIRADRDLDGRLGPGDELLGGSRIVDGEVTRVVPADPIPLRAAWGAPRNVIVPEPVHYRLFVEGAAVSNVRLEVVNRVTGGGVEIEEIEQGTPLGGASGFHSWQFASIEPPIMRLSGAVVLTEDVRVPFGGTLEIAPGTTISLAPDVSVLSRGRVEARGTQDAPIRIVAADSTLPWGTFALQGPGASGSVFEHVEFARGGGDRIDRVAYKGMVSVHAADDVHLRDVRFSDNLRSDDSFNAVYSRVHLDRCAFSNANGDAVDFDYSSGTITNCIFEDSRNDAIDLMTSTPLIRSNRMIRSGDKGISVGEASEPVIVDNVISEADRGIEIKDRSSPTILHNSIEQTQIGILGQVKNWRYAGGGRGRLLMTRMSDNAVDLQLDPDSRLAVIGSGTDGAPGRPEDAPRWALVGYGLPPAPAGPGSLGIEWAGEPAAGPLRELRFDGPVPFRESADGWETRGAVRLRHINRSLRANIERGTASWSRDLDWSAGEDAEMAIEYTGRDLLDARVVVTTADGDVVAELTLPSPNRIGLVTIPLPAGAYSLLRIEARADGGAVSIDPISGLGERRGGRLDITRIRLYATGRRR